MQSTDSKPKCFGTMIETAGCGICGNCSVVFECEVKSKISIITKYIREKNND